MGSCCVNGNRNMVVERITVHRKHSITGCDKMSVLSPPNWVGRSKRASVYIVNNEDVNDKYIFENELGTGFFGTVRVVIPRNDLDKKYACKSIDKSKLPTNKINNLIREIETLSLVDHPNIIKYYETYNDNRYFHLIMEYCTGGDLFTHVSSRKFFSETEACQLIFKITSAIVHCHSLSIVHRDLKPENILFENKAMFSEIKLIDFGLSRKYLKEDDLHSVVGSPFYVAPEVLDGTYDEKCDVWSIGIITYCLLSGRPPFTAASRGELFQKIKSHDVSFSKPIWENISHSAKEFIKAILIKNPKKRPTAKKVLQMDWFKNIFQDETDPNKINPEILIHLSHFHRPYELTKTVLNLVVKDLSAKDVDQLKRTFNALDKNKTGLITINDLKSAFEFCNLEMKKENLQSILNITTRRYSKYIKDGDEDQNEEKIDYTSFIAAVMDRKKLVSRNKLWEIFKKFDTEQTGFISIFSIEKAFERTGKKKSFDEIREMFKEIGLKVDDMIDFDTFCDIIEKDLY